MDSTKNRSDIETSTYLNNTPSIELKPKPVKSKLIQPNASRRTSNFKNSFHNTQIALKIQQLLLEIENTDEHDLDKIKELDNVLENLGYSRKYNPNNNKLIKEITDEKVYQLL